MRDLVTAGIMDRKSSFTDRPREKRIGEMIKRLHKANSTEMLKTARRLKTASFHL